VPISRLCNSIIFEVKEKKFTHSNDGKLHQINMWLNNFSEGRVLFDAAHLEEFSRTIRKLGLKSRVREGNTAAPEKSKPSEKRPRNETTKLTRLTLTRCRSEHRELSRS
jgi:hypothetical protein